VTRNVNALLNPQGLIDLSSQVYVLRNLMSMLGVPKPLLDSASYMDLND
jgi:hypothetical protein